MKQDPAASPLLVKHIFFDKAPKKKKKKTKTRFCGIKHEVELMMGCQAQNSIKIKEKTKKDDDWEIISS